MYVHVAAAYCCQPSTVVFSVGLCVTLVSPAKTAEPIEMPFGLWARIGPRNHVLDGGSDPHGKGVILRGKGASRCKVYWHSVVICAKTSEPIEMPFGLWTWVGPGNHVLHVAEIPHA